MDPYRRVAKREVYRNPWLVVEVHDVVHPTGAAGEHVLIVSPAASGVLVVDGNDVILAQQPRFGARETVLEIVKGGADPGEGALECARRELREELGYDADTWTPLGYTYEIPSIMDHPVALFLASGLHDVATDPEDVETIERRRMPFEEAYAAAIDGRINDAVTIAALLRARSKGVPARSVPH
ncbi:MAG TPA: NUDIX hydrolase [Candidatus Baltobacteraceae bacterium]|nr:NUDIX hydrolase [Candidatus Baltobacteraceae bacterium]